MKGKPREFYIKRHIDFIIEEFSYKNRSRFYKEKCSCYQENKPCHKMKDLNCFFCYCPFYDNSKEEGGCKRNSPDGKWFHSDKLPKGKIWDCSDCVYPHKKEIVRAYLEKNFKL